jgi:hypothetical protein
MLDSSLIPIHLALIFFNGFTGGPRRLLDCRSRVSLCPSLGNRPRLAVLPTLSSPSPRLGSARWTQLLAGLNLSA